MKTEISQASEEDIHIIFSTDCSSFQHWQSYLLFYSAFRIKQPGKITRIASGCNDEDKVKELEWHKKHISSAMSEKYKIHFTPHFSAVKDENGKVKGDYKFFNKPMGLLHWFENGEDMGVDGDTGKVKSENTIVALLDPDMVLMKHLSADFSNEKMVIVSPIAREGQKFRVEHGVPFGQHYAFGAQWRTFGLDTITGDSQSNAKKVNDHDGRKYYPVGPPYLATARDMHKIAQKWVEFVPKVHAEYPYLLAEMFAYCIAAAHLNLPHQLIDHLMVSNTQVGGEGWNFVDNLTKNVGSNHVCEIMTNTDVDSLHSPASTVPLPTVIHYCQRYIIGQWFFGKRRVPKNYFTCDHPLLKVPPMDLDEIEYKIAPGEADSETNRKGLHGHQSLRESFVICSLTRIINEASLFFKENGCPDEKINTEKSMNMHTDLF